jgi:hypothetical protein
MNYSTFRNLWHEALSEAGLLFFPPWPSERIDLRDMSRSYKISIPMPDMDRVRPFHIVVTLSWRWDPLQSARTATTEEDLLVELLGQDGYYLVTERPWLRVDVTLSATLPLDAPLPMPQASTWQRWAKDVTRRMATLLPDELPGVDEANGEVLLFWRGDPVARLKCHPDGQLYLTGVELSAWQGIELLRQWDNPGRPHDDDTDLQLASFCEWLRASLQIWEDSLQHFGRNHKQ